MKKILKRTQDRLVDALICITVVVFLLVLTGCVTKATIETFDDKGVLVSRTVTTSDVVDKITQSTKDKTLIIWESGWLAYLSVSPGTTEDPTPHFKIWGGKLDKGYISIFKDHQNINWTGVAEVVSATNKSLSISPAGISEEDKK